MIDLTPRDYQKTIFETAKNANTLVVLPTGVGKTLIALMLTIERLKQHPGKKALILAPTRPLVEQHYESFKKQLPELFADIQLFTGSVPAKERKKIWDTADIILSTPQCVSNDLEKYLYTLSDVSLLVIDEAHRCLKNYSYTAVAEKYKSQATSQRILGLTASPGSEMEKVKQICKHLNISEVEVRTRDSPDVKPYLQELEFNKVPVEFPKEFIEIRTLLQNIYNSKVFQLKSRNLLFGPTNKITLLKLQKKLGAQLSSQNFNAMIGLSLCAQAIKVAHAIELLETQTLSGFHTYLKQIIKDAEEKKSKAVQQIVNSPEFKATLISLNDLIAKKVEHPKIEKVREIADKELKENKKAKLIIFTQFRETASKLTETLNQNKDIKAAVFIGQTKKKTQSGTSGLNQKEQKGIISQFREGKINVICATSIGEEGLDIPEVSAVIFYEPIPSEIRKIQRTGRTARLNAGKLFLLVTEKTKDEISHYASTAREKKMYRTLDKIKDEIKKQPKTLDYYK